jgi:hypothetical protein
MVAKAIHVMPADELKIRWLEHIGRIKRENIYLFTTRYRFDSIQKMFQKNKRLGAEGGNVYRWLLGLWGRDALMGVRRELDGVEGVVNLVKLLYELEARPEVLTREWFLETIPKGASEYLVEYHNQEFDKMGAVKANLQQYGPKDHLPPSPIAADREALQAATLKAYGYAQQMLAHRTPIDDLEITVGEINAALAAIEKTFVKYVALLTGASLMKTAAEIQYDWDKCFTYAWIEPEADEEKE